MKPMLVTAGAVLLSSCASLPPVDYSYYPAKGTVFVALTQAVDCSKDQKTLVVASSTPTVTVKYGADHASEAWSFKASQLRNGLSNQDFTIARYEDGRLKSVNVQSTGQGEAILKSVLNVVSAVLPFVGGAGQGLTTQDICKEVANLGGGKPVTIGYASSYELRALSDGAPADVEPTPDSAPLRDVLNKTNLLGSVQVRLLMSARDLDAIAPTELASEVTTLRLQKVSPGALTVLAKGTQIWQGDVLVPKNDGYDLPVPKGAAFGKATFAVEVAESGAVTKLSYGREAGAAGPLNVLTAGATAFKPDTDTDRANAAKAEADVIAQTQRLARCRAQPEECK